jgi:hypothetical protein
MLVLVILEIYELGRSDSFMWQDAMAHEDWYSRSSTIKA